MDNQGFDAVVHALMTDHDYQAVNIRTVDLWMLLCACQSLAYDARLHGGSHSYYRDLGKRLQAIVVALHPEARELAERGWDTFVEMDEPSGPINPYEGWSYPSRRDDEPYYGSEEEW